MRNAWGLRLGSACMASAGVLALALLQPAVADEVVHHGYHAAPGQQITVGAYGRVDRRCLPTGKPVITVEGGPTHGQISMAAGTHIVRRSVGSVQCDGREIEDTHVYYTPAPSFQGIDQFQLTVRFHDAIVQNYVTVSVP